VVRRVPRYFGGFVGRDFTRGEEGIYIIARKVGNCAALASLVAIKKSSAGCFVVGGGTVPEVVGIQAALSFSTASPSSFAVTFFGKWMLPLDSIL
jgi:hypothetical protein